MCFFVMALHRCYLRSQNANCILDLVDCPIRLFQHPKNRGMCHFRSQYAKYKNANGLLDPKLRLSSCAESSLQLMPGCQRWHRRWHRRRRRALCHCGGCTLCTRVHFAIFNFRCAVQFSVIQLFTFDCYGDEKEGADKYWLLPKIGLIERPWKQNLSGLYWH